jgi:hypothetical protein
VPTDETRDRLDGELQAAGDAPVSGVAQGTATGGTLLHGLIDRRVSNCWSRHPAAKQSLGDLIGDAQVLKADVDAELRRVTLEPGSPMGSRAHDR